MTTSQRRATCAQAFLRYLAGAEAYEVRSGTSVEDFLASPLSLFQDPADLRVAPPRFASADVDAAVAKLGRREMIAGIDTAHGLVLAWLTDDGVECVEHFDGDAAAMIAHRRGPPGQTTNNFSMDGSSNNQIATGANSRQVMSIGASPADLALGLQGIVELLLAQGVFTDRRSELTQRQDEVLDVLETDSPDTPPLVQDFL